MTQYLGNYLPGNPTTFVVQSMPGGGGLRATNWLYAQGAKDGTTLGMIHSTAPLAPLYGAKGAQFDPRNFVWIGSMNSARASVSLARFADPNLGRHENEAVIVAAPGRARRWNAADDDEQVSRHQDQDHRRLQGRHRHLPRHGAGRGAGPLRRAAHFIAAHPPQLAAGA